MARPTVLAIRYVLGLYELRIDWGPGFRVYYAMIGQARVFLLCGGDKRTQPADIAKAHEYLKTRAARAVRCVAMILTAEGSTSSQIEPVVAGASPPNLKPSHTDRSAGGKGRARPNDL